MNNFCDDQIEIKPWGLFDDQEAQNYSEVTVGHLSIPTFIKNSSSKKDVLKEKTLIKKPKKLSVDFNYLRKSVKKCFTPNQTMVSRKQTRKEKEPLIKKEESRTMYTRGYIRTLNETPEKKKSTHKMEKVKAELLNCYNNLYEKTQGKQNCKNTDCMNKIFPMREPIRQQNFRNKSSSKIQQSKTYELEKQFLVKKSKINMIFKKNHQKYFGMVEKIMPKLALQIYCKRKNLIQRMHKF